MNTALVMEQAERSICQFQTNPLELEQRVARATTLLSFKMTGRDECIKQRMDSRSSTLKLRQISRIEFPTRSSSTKKNAERRDVRECHIFIDLHILLYANACLIEESLVYGTP